MFNIILHIIFFSISFYYIYINGTDYDKPFYKSVNEMHRYFYKKRKGINKDIKSYEKTVHKEEDREQYLKHRKARCEKCHEKTNVKHRKKCLKENNCSHYDKENFSNIEHLTEKDKTRKSFHNQTIFIEFKIIGIMFLCTILASNQHYGIGPDKSVSIKTIFNGFTGGIENLMFLVYIIVLLMFLYGEMKKLYGED